MKKTKIKKTKIKVVFKNWKVKKNVKLKIK